MLVHASKVRPWVVSWVSSERYAKLKSEQRYINVGGVVCLAVLGFGFEPIL